MSQESNEAAAVWVDLNDLTPWEDNPRNNEAAVAKVAESIKRFGFASPIVARSEDGMVIAGHTRLLAAKSLGLNQVPVRYMKLDPADAALLALADNRLGEISEWHGEKLENVLKGLVSADLDLDVAGFTEEELNALIGPSLGDLADADPGAPGESDIRHNHADILPSDIPAVTKEGEVITIGRHVLKCGDCVELLKGLEDSSIDAIVTDPPYGIGMDNGAGWDGSVPGLEWAMECRRVLKPGGHIIAFAATRTVHRLAVALEDAGLEIRDQIAWVQYQGFPKNHDISRSIDKTLGLEREVVGYSDSGAAFSENVNKGRSVPITAPTSEAAKRLEGWGTALKPSQEPAVLARKPLEGTLAQNAIKWGTGGINIEATKFAYGDNAWPGPSEAVGPRSSGGWGSAYVGGHPDNPIAKNDPGARWPANIYHASKPSKSEREAGCEDLSVTVVKPGGPGGWEPKQLGNWHPTVKPSKLCSWLVKLVTPIDGVVLDTFCGSGTTMVSAELEGYASIGFEQNPAYCDIIRARLSHLVGE